MDPKMVQLADQHFQWIEQQKAQGWGAGSQQGSTTK